MRPVKVILMANDWPGLQIANLLRKHGDNIVRLYLQEPEARKLGDQIIEATGLPPENVFSAQSLRDESHVKQASALDADFIVTVYWAHLLNDFQRGIARDSVNFHPALLPINRGWFPHVHSILDGTPTGVTLHRIDSGADTGPIWQQRPVPLLPTDTAGDIYVRLQQEIVRLFDEYWPQIRSHEIEPFDQDHTKAVYHKKKEIESLDEINLDEPTTARAVLNLLRARCFGDQGFAYFEQTAGERVYVRLQLGSNSNFKGKD